MQTSITPNPFSLFNNMSKKYPSALKNNAEGFASGYRGCNDQACFTSLTKPSLKIELAATAA
jgi:hypothetical protein